MAGQLNELRATQAGTSAEVGAVLGTAQRLNQGTEKLLSSHRQELGQVRLFHVLLLLLLGEPLLLKERQIVATFSLRMLCRVLCCSWS